MLDRKTHTSEKFLPNQPIAFSALNIHSPETLIIDPTFLAVT